MQFTKYFKRTETVGLDIGHDAVKAVALAVRGGQRVVLGAGTLDTRAEGILDEHELRSSLAVWLQQQGWAKTDICAGLPQYLATMQVSDFPPGAAESLEEMVEYETRQLAGLSEESFLHDYHVMDARFGRRNPVLIGICRESVVRERSENLTEASVRLADLGMNGIAMVNAVFDLHPEAKSEEAPQLLLDIGGESSTLVVLAAGQILFVGSLLFGAEKFRQAIAAEAQVSDEEAARRLVNATLRADDARSALGQCVQHLEAEIRTAVEHWRSQERPEIGTQDVVRIWLSGGGAMLTGLDRHLANAYGCLVTLYGPPLGAGGTMAPTLVTAFGLALQGIGAAQVTLSLIPPAIAWLRQRERRFLFLAVAAVLAGILVGAAMIRGHGRMVRERASLAAERAELQRCEALIPQLEETTAAIQHHEKMLIPFVEKGNRARRFLQSIEELAKARADGDWFIYLADAASYQQGRIDPETGKKAKPAESATPPRPLFAPGAMDVTPGVGDPDLPTPYPSAITVMDMPQGRTMIVAGYTRFQPERVYEPVRDIVRKLNESELFRDVDLLPEEERVVREDIFAPWLEFLRSEPELRYRSFSLRLPFRSLEVSRQPEDRTAK